MDGWVVGWLENEFLKKIPSPKFGLESQFGTSDFKFVKKARKKDESRNEEKRNCNEKKG